MIGEIHRSRQKLRNPAELRQPTSTFSLAQLNRYEVHAIGEEPESRIRPRARICAQQCGPIGSSPAPRPASTSARSEQEIATCAQRTSDLSSRQRSRRSKSATAANISGKLAFVL